MRTNSTAIATLVEQALPTKGSAVAYNKNSQMYETERYVSAAGNAYFRGLKLSDRIVVEFSFGDGYCYRFINAIYIYCFNGTSKQLIATRSYHCQIFSERFCIRECENMVADYLKTQAEMVGGQVEDAHINEFAQQLIAATNQKLIA